MGADWKQGRISWPVRGVANGAQSPMIPHGGRLHRPHWRIRSISIVIPLYDEGGPCCESQG